MLAPLERRKDETMTDVLSVIGSISAGLNLIDKFRSLALRFMHQPEKAPSVVAKGVDGQIEIKRNGQIAEVVDVDENVISAWNSEEVRRKALEQRIQINWGLFNTLFASLPTLAGLQKAQIEAEMERIKSELCQDFREMLEIIERSLHTSLGDHYSLYAICGVRSYQT
jgi:hypothetical protein